jgi:hypothetical protein
VQCFVVTSRCVFLTPGLELTPTHLPTLVEIEIRGEFSSSLGHSNLRKIITLVSG